ncbi:MAG: MazG nucleotide pyrophosphohydrolase domain-containing protein [Phycisphaerales bacterium]|jgi:NTP pyrophosphatase (non-canonical NTP hydrolase)|nr:MazG nucleotide pyrophosphohydrolase domain-containing protein [Phycisphaerales bacterium]
MNNPSQSNPEDQHSPSADFSIREFQELIKDRYFASDNARGTAGTFLYLTEEFGELATALANNNRPNRPPNEAERMNLEEEFADVLAWLATLANINNVDLTSTLIKYTDPNRVQGVKE